MEYFDIVDESGTPVGGTVSREAAHRDGIRHRTSHVWVVRGTGGRYEVLLQKRSVNKDSFPGMYDTSSAGHIPAGSEPLESALRELREELGISASPDQLTYMGMCRIRFEEEFHGRVFRENEVSRVYVYREPVDADKLTLQASEVDEVRWFGLEEVRRALQRGDKSFCVPPEGLEVLRGYLEKNDPAPDAGGV